jgi:hypothetical protein
MKAVSKFSTQGRLIYVLFWRVTMFYYPEVPPLALDVLNKPTRFFIYG